MLTKGLLIHLTGVSHMTSDKLNHAQKLVFEALVNHGNLNTFQLRDLGFCSPSSLIFELRDKGLTIKTTLKPAYGNTGRIHPRIAHYSLGRQK